MDTTTILESPTLKKKLTRGGVSLIEVTPFEESLLRNFIMTASRGSERQMLRHIQLSVQLTVPEFVWHELLELMVAGLIPGGSLTATLKSSKFVEILSFRSKSQGRASIPSDVLRSAGDAHLAYEKFIEQTSSLVKKLQDLGVCEEQIGLMIPRTREVQGLWSLNLEEALSVIKLAGRETVIWEVRELAINLRELLRDGVSGFNLIGSLG